MNTSRAGELYVGQARESVAFANLLSGRVADPAVRIEVAAHGDDQPAVNSQQQKPETKDKS